MLTHLTDTLTLLITNLYVTTGLIGIIIAMAIESCCIPLPSEIVMPLAGIMLVSGKLLHGTNSLLGLVLVALAGAVGCLIGSIAAYGIGYGGGRPLMLKYGRYLLISQHDADKADHFFQSGVAQPLSSPAFYLWFVRTSRSLLVSQGCLLSNFASIHWLALSCGVSCSRILAPSLVAIWQH